MSRVLLSVVCFLGISSVHADNAPAPLKVGINTLITTYQSNEALADEIYTDRTCDVTGTLRRVVRGDRSKKDGLVYVVELLTEAGTPPTLFSFAFKHRKKLSECKTNQAITIRGRCRGRTVWAAQPGSGKENYTEIHFLDCELVENR